MRRTTGLLLGLVLIGGALSASPARASDYCDYEESIRPTYVASRVSPTAIEIGKYRRTLSVYVTAADNCAVDGDWLDAELTPVGNSSAGSISFYDFVLVSGSRSYGTWRSTKVISDYEDGGRWELSSIEIYDDAFNKTTRLYAGVGVTIRHATTTSMARPKRLRSGAVRLRGKASIAGSYEDARVRVQRKVGGSGWRTFRIIKADYADRVRTTVRPARTTRYRFAQVTTATTGRSFSGTYRVAP